jgi:hypothetical protein
VQRRNDERCLAAHEWKLPVIEQPILSERHRTGLIFFPKKKSHRERF